MGYRVDIAEEEQFPSTWSLVLTYGVILLGGLVLVVGLVVLAFMVGGWLMGAMFWGSILLAAVSVPLALWLA
jgi:hypothetical protein